MPIELVKPAIGLAVPLADAKLNLRIAGTRMDIILDAWIRGVTRHAEGLMQRALISQDWRLTLDRFPRAIVLRYPPVSAVASVKYYDTNNVQQTLDPACYIKVANQLAHRAQCWPATYERPDAVEVLYTAGYGADATSIPADIRLYLLAKLNEQFDPAARPEKDTVQSSFIDNLLSDYIVYG